MSFANPAKKVEVVDPTAPSDELVAPAAAAVDRFDIEALRLPQSFVETAGVVAPERPDTVTGLP
jgi:hypothetical protein